MKIKLLLLLLPPVIFFAACDKNDRIVKTPAPQPSVAATPAPVSANTGAKYFDGRGKVTKINMELGSVELDHEAIKGLMPAMIMEFYVRNKAELADLQIGDRVSFVLEDKAGAETITEIKKQ